MCVLIDHLNLFGCSELLRDQNIEAIVEMCGSQLKVLTTHHLSHDLNHLLQ